MSRKGCHCSLNLCGHNKGYITSSFARFSYSGHDYRSARLARSYHMGMLLHGYCVNIATFIMLYNATVDEVDSWVSVLACTVQCFPQHTKCRVGHPVWIELNWIITSNKWVGFEQFIFLWIYLSTPFEIFAGETLQCITSKPFHPWKYWSRGKGICLGKLYRWAWTWDLWDLVVVKPETPSGTPNVKGLN